MSSLTSSRGFTLVETLVATGILITALAGIAQLLVLSAQWSQTAAGSNAAVRAAQEKLEALRGAPFGYDEGARPLTDDALEQSPATTLGEDTDPYVDAVADGALKRRWRISPFGAGPPDAIVIEVCVFREDSDVAESCLATIRTRQS